MDQQGLGEAQIKAQIRGALEGSKAELKILAFVEKEVAYTAVDLAGLRTSTLPEQHQDNPDAFAWRDLSWSTFSTPSPTVRMV